jgi:hypothetical protein
MKRFRPLKDMDKDEAGISEKEIKKENELSAQQQVIRLQTHAFY